MAGLRALISLALLALLVSLGVAPQAAALAAPNGAPDVVLPADQATDEDTSFAFTGAASITVTDPDAGGDDVRLDLSVPSGVLDLASSTGLTFVAGSSNHSGLIAVTGNLVAIDAALDGLSFTPAQDAHDSVTLTAVVDDLGHTGDDGPQTDTDTMDITVNAVNDAPVNVVPSGVGTYAGVPKVLSVANLNAISVTEHDGGDTEIQVGLTSTGGTIQLASTTGVIFDDGADGTASMTFRATTGDVTNALNGLTFTPNAGFTGQGQIAVHTDDLGHTGSGGALTDTDTVPIEVSEPGDTIYWTASKNTLQGHSAAIGRAAPDGSGGANLVTGPELQDIPTGVAIDAVAGRIYWANSGALPPATPGIYSADLDGTDKQLFLSSALATAAGTKLDSVFGLVVDQRTRRLYWANSDNVTAADRGISWISLDDQSVGGRVNLSGATVGSPRALAIDTVHDRVYFTNWSISPSIAWASLDGSGGGTFSITGASVGQASGIAYDAATNRLFWGNGSGGLASERIKVATLPEPFSSSITGATFSIAPLVGGGIRSLAVDPVAGRLYHANSATNTISHAQLDGSGGGADLPLGTAYSTSPDGVAILRRPAALGVPTLTGAPAVGATLTCGAVTWDADDPGAALYRAPASTAISWTRDGAAVGGATGTTITATTAGEYRCTRAATNFAGTAAAQSAPIQVVAPLVTLGVSSVAVSSTGKVTVPVSCANAACEGNLSLQSGGSTLGSGTFSLAASAAGTVAIDLTTAGRTLVSAGPSAAVTAVLTVTGATPTSTSLTLTSARAPSVQLLTGKAPVRAGKAKVKLSCGADGPCAVSYLLIATIKGRSKTLATAEVEVGSGATVVLKLRLSKAARAALRDGPVKATQTVTSDIEVGLDTTITRSLKLVT